MIFTIFLIIAAWNIPEPFPHWLRICLTVFGVLHALFCTGERVVKIERKD